ncbi:MAG TPA: SDR family NAD(P)-dependent oxidoreductase [Planctomycetota bacterium]|nr:SDR family NAD(P)-dependent oxidoreductase [Planctomycetota bacterium]
MTLAGFDNMTAWVTGASSGIGAALAHGLGERGAKLILSGRRDDALQRVADSHDGATLVLPFEATDYDALPRIVTTAEAWQGKIDLLIHCAGIGQQSLAIDTSLDVYRRLMEVDFFAPLGLTQLALPAMVSRRAGAIAVISSVAGKVGAPNMAGYCAAKHAVVGYFDALRAEVECAYGIKVHVALPGSVKTNIGIHALRGDGAPVGEGGASSEHGMAADRAATLILEGIAAGAREIPVAEGLELTALQKRASHPDELFDFTAQEGARLAAARAARRRSCPNTDVSKDSE